MPRPKTMTRAQSANKYARANYDDIRLQVAKGSKEAIRAHAAKNGEKLQTYIKRLIQQDSGLEL